MSYFYSFLFCLLYLLTSENAESTNSEDEVGSVYLIKGGYRPEPHYLSKYVVSIQLSTRSVTKQRYMFGATHYCGGAILNSKLILTSAHCLKRNGHLFRPSQLEVVAGTPKRLLQTQHTQVKSVDKLRVHDGFNELRMTSDIGIIILKSEIEFDGIYAEPIPLPLAEPPVGENCVSLGWGKFFEDGPNANDIVYVNVSIINDYVCLSKIYIFTPSEICAYDPNDISKDSCQGDSGGPLICGGTVSGIVSYGYGCGIGVPGVYTNIHQYLDWINESKCGKARPFLRMLWFLSLIWTMTL